MTLVAFQRSLYMIGTLAGRNHIIMTAGTYSQNFVVIHGIIRHGYPGCRAGLVTRIAHIRRIDMVGALAGSNRTIVATRTRADNLRMINCAWLYRRPGCRKNRMAGVALIRAVNVVGTLAARNDTVMAVGAVIHKRGMIRRATA